MDNYEKLLEMDTDNDSNVQLQLYKECIAGAGGGKSEAMEWLNLAVENGNEEAVEILNAINNENSPKENKYANLSMLQLLEMADFDYKAAKELYCNRNKNVSYDEQINYLTKLCSFEEADCEDYENLARAYYGILYKEIIIDRNIRSIKNKINKYCHSIINTCENAIELGSKKARVYLANILLLLFPKSENTFEICNQVATEGSICNKFLHYVAIKYNVTNAPNQMYLPAWEEELNNYPGFLNSNIGKLYMLIKTSDASKIIDFEKSFSIDEYSEDEAIVLALFLKMFDSKSSIVNKYYVDDRCMDFIYPLYLYMCDAEREQTEHIAKQNELRQQEKQQEQIRLDKEKKRKQNIELAAKICSIASLVLGPLALYLFLSSKLFRLSNISASIVGLFITIPGLATGIFSYVKLRKTNSEVLRAIATAGIILSSFVLFIVYAVIIS